MKHVVTGAPIRQTILVTGFGAFPGNRCNPTAAILAALDRERPQLARLGIGLRCALIPVVFAEIDAAMRDAVAAHRPDAILHLGLAARRTTISVETRAINRTGPLHPDARRQLPAGQTLAAGAPAALTATYPAARILAALGGRRLSARRSIDAGDYVCNATLYRSLAARHAARIGFLHVPKPRDARRPRVPPAGSSQAGLTQAALTRAALVAVLTMMRRH